MGKPKSPELLAVSWLSLESSRKEFIWQLLRREWHFGRISCRRGNHDRLDGDGVIRGHQGGKKVAKLKNKKV